MRKSGKPNTYFCLYLLSTTKALTLLFERP